VVKAIVAGAKHDQHIVNLEQKLQHELGLIKVQEPAPKPCKYGFPATIALIKANHQAKGQIRLTAFSSLSKQSSKSATGDRHAAARSASTIT
jgi:hypothetical protein